MLTTLEDTIGKIEKGSPLMIAGLKETLEQLPKGNWIGGTIPFFNHGEQENMLEISTIPEGVRKVKLKVYSIDNIHYIRHDAYDKGFSLLILPAESRIHHSFAMNSRDYPFQNKGTLAGWVAGYPQDKTDEAYVIYGPNGTWFQDKAVVLHSELKELYSAELETLNLFEPGEGPDIQFKESGFSCKELIFNGSEQDLASFRKEFPSDMNTPLISMEVQRTGNVSIRELSENRLSFYAPVFRDQTYRMAQTIPRYHETFQEKLRIMQEETEQTVFTCNCVLNHLQAGADEDELHHGPVSFGEIAEHLLNQTALTLRIVKRDQNQS